MKMYENQLVSEKDIVCCVPSKTRTPEKAIPCCVQPTNRTSCSNKSVTKKENSKKFSCC